MNKKALFITAGILVAAGVGFFIWMRKKNASDPSNSNTLGASALLSNSNSNIGKNAYAKYDGLAVFNTDGDSVYKTATKGEYIGNVSSINGDKVLVASGSRYIYNTNGLAVDFKTI